MIFHPFFLLFTGLMTTLFNALPAWSITIGHGCYDGACAQSSDNNMLHYGLAYLGILDRFIPIHDGLIPVVGITGAIGIGMLGYKGVLLVLNLVRGSGA